MNLDTLEEELLMFSKSSPDCYEAEFVRKYIPRLIAVENAGRKCLETDGKDTFRLEEAMKELEKEC